MKVAIQCASPLLQRSLERFLQGHLSTLKQCDIVVRDKRVDDDKPTLFIGSQKEPGDIQKPFSKSQLLLILEKRLEELLVKQDLHSIQSDEAAEDQNGDFEILERRIAVLTQEYQQNIIKAVRAFYEK